MSQLDADLSTEVGNPHGLRTVLHHVLALADEDGTGVRDPHRRLTWSEVVDRTRRTASLLADMGVARGGNVGGYVDNDINGLVVGWAANLIGASWTPLNRRLDDAGLAYQLEVSRPQVLLAYVEDAERLHALAPKVALLVISDGDEPARAPAGARRLRDASQLGPWSIDTLPALTDPALILFSSGTTGMPKACVISHGYLANFARLGFQNVPRTADDVTWTAMPMFHLAGMAHLVQSAMVGGEFILARKFSVSRFWDEISTHDVTFAALLSTMIPRIAHGEYPDMPKHRLRVVTGEPFPLELQEVWKRRYGVERAGSVALGQTEAGFLTTLRDHPFREGTCGLATDSFELDVVDDDGQTVGVGEVGQLICRPTHDHAMFDGYLGAEPHGVVPGGPTWWGTGDWVRRDEDGYVYFVDRGGDRIRRGGENVASALIEKAANAYEDVEQAAALGVPSPEADDSILLVVTARAGAVIDLSTLYTWMCERLPHYARPDYIDVVDALPVNASSKVLKRALRERGVTPSAWTPPS